MKRMYIAVLLTCILMLTAAPLARAQSDEYAWLEGLWDWRMVFPDSNTFQKTALCSRSVKASGVRSCNHIL
jgi:hypothetical protein